MRLLAEPHRPQTWIVSPILIVLTRVILCAGAAARPAPKAAARPAPKVRRNRHPTTPGMRVQPHSPVSHHITRGTISTNLDARALKFAFQAAAKPKPAARAATKPAARTGSVRAARPAPVAKRGPNPLRGTMRIGK